MESSRDPHGYRMVVSTKEDFSTTAAVAEAQLDVWLTGKKYDASALRDGRNEIAAGVTLDHDSGSGRDGTHTRWRMRETHPGRAGTWQSTLTIGAVPYARDEPRRTWLQVDIEHHPNTPDVRPVRPKAPKIAGLLLDALRAEDSLAAVTSAPALITPDDVNEVIEELCDEERRLPLVIASVPHGQDTEFWMDSVVDKAFSQLPGLAVLYVLTPEAQNAFNKELVFHSVYAGAIRTYLPGVDPAWKPDAQRHPVMSRTTIDASHHQRVSAVLASLPLRLATRLPLPQPLAVVPVQRPRPRPATQGSELEKLKIENETLLALLDEAAQTETNRVDQIRGLTCELQELESRTSEISELYGELQRTRRRASALQIELNKLGHLAHVESEDQADCPKTFAEILERIGALAHIRFTGSAKVTRSLDDQSVDNWVEMAWDGLLALEDFAAASAAGTAQGDFRSWCSSSSADGHPFPAGKVKMRESDSVGNRKRWKQERTFPVPPAVRFEEKMYMEAHLRIGGGNTVAPRLHFYDDGGNTGLLYVGYIGPHLTNTMT